MCFLSFHCILLDTILCLRNEYHIKKQKGQAGDDIVYCRTSRTNAVKLQGEVVCIVFHVKPRTGILEVLDWHSCCWFATLKAQI